MVTDGPLMASRLPVGAHLEIAVLEPHRHDDGEAVRVVRGLDHHR
jgi:hypothetical protein